MESADYVHLLRLNEQASREAPERYRRRVLRFAVLGYLAVFLFGLLAAAGGAGTQAHVRRGGA